MKRTSIFFLFTLFSSIVIAQTGNYVVTGKITDAVTKAPMQAASVFAQNTTIGTATDGEGNFKLYLPAGGYDLVITFTGYENTVRRVTAGDAENSNLQIEVKQKEKAMEDVVIKSSNEVKDGWEKYGQFFLENFIGKTANSQLCSITNKEVLKFYYYKKRNRLKVLADVPLEMNNQALGYKIKYALDSFTYEYNTQAAIYTGYPLFEEIAASDSLQTNTWHTNRAKAYNGSILHFMRSVYQKNLAEQGFEIQFVAKRDDTETAVKLADYYAAINYNKDDSTGQVAILPNQPDVAVIYKNELPDTGYVTQNPDENSKQYQLSVINIAPNESLGIEQNGYYFDQDDIVITGYWTWDKIADMLPYNYIPR